MVTSEVTPDTLAELHVCDHLNRLIDNQPALGTGKVSIHARDYIRALSAVVLEIDRSATGPRNTETQYLRGILRKYTLWAMRKGVPPETVKFLATVHFS